MLVSRRSVLTHLGGMAALAALPHGPALAIEARLPTLEDAFGEKRMAWLNALFRAQYLPLISDVVEEAIFDRPNHFRVSPEFREGMTRFLHDGKPVEILINSDPPSIILPSGRTADQLSIDCMVAFVFRKAKAFPPDTEHNLSEFRANSDLVWWRWWQGDDWQEVGWEPPPKRRKRRSPRYEWPELPI